MKRDAQGAVQLSPLRFHFDANELRLPVRLGLLNASGKQDLIVYVIHPESRFEVANYANTFIPTNLEVADGVRNNFPRSSRSCSTPPSRRWAARWSSPSTPGRRPAAIPARRRRCRRDDLATLGLDVLEGIGVAVPPPRTNKPGAAAPMRRPPPFFGGAPSWVLTRLHARYSQETLSEDLIFREAKPAMGGRANWNGTNGDEGASVSATAGGGVNNFQGRYIIRHYWDKPVACKDPRWDNWGGPPDNPFGAPQPTAAKGLATAPRGKVVLKTEVRSPVPLLGIAGKAPPRRKGATTK